MSLLLLLSKRERLLLSLSWKKTEFLLINMNNKRNNLKLQNKTKKNLKLKWILDWNGTKPNEREWSREKISFFFQDVSRFIPIGSVTALNWAAVVIQAFLHFWFYHIHCFCLLDSHLREKCPRNSQRINNQFLKISQNHVFCWWYSE